MDSALDPCVVPFCTTSGDGYEYVVEVEEPRPGISPLILILLPILGKRKTDRLSIDEECVNKETRSGAERIESSAR